MAYMASFPYRRFFVSLTKPWWLVRARRIADYLAPHAQGARAIIDVGAGNGLIGEMLAVKNGASVVLLDVIDWNLSSLSMRLFDGRKIPFPDKHFDLALLVDVLHHTPHDAELLGDALRVARSVMVIEWAHRPGFFLEVMKLFERVQEPLCGMASCYHQRSEDEWFAFFKKFPVTVEKMGPVSYWQRAFKLTPVG